MAEAASYSTMRVAARLANGFALDLVKLGGFGRDIVDGLLLTAISQANIALINRSPELQRTYATLEQVPPDELRRPVSINAVAASLRIPFETARRRIASLAELGIVTITPQGVVLPRGPLNSPFYRMAAEAHYGLVRNLYHRLQDIGLLGDLPRAGPLGFDAANPPIRLVMRLSANYALRLAEPVSLYIGDLVTGIVLMDIVHANTEHLPDTEGGQDDPGPEGFVADDRRRPVRATALAERLGIPAETVRRHVNRLIKDGRCTAVEDGYLVPSAVLARGPYLQYMVDNQMNLHRLFSGLAEFGVLSLWDAERAELRGAA